MTLSGRRIRADWHRAEVLRSMALFEQYMHAVHRLPGISKRLLRRRKRELLQHMVADRDRAWVTRSLTELSQLCMIWNVKNYEDAHRMLTIHCGVAFDEDDVASVPSEYSHSD